MDGASLIVQLVKNLPVGRWEGGSGWGIHVNPWLIHVNVWKKPLQYCKVISLQLKKKKKRVPAMQETLGSDLIHQLWSRVGLLGCLSSSLFLQPKSLMLSEKGSRKWSPVVWLHAMSKNRQICRDRKQMSVCLALGVVREREDDS